MADLPQLKAPWKSYHDIHDVDVLLVPNTPITARPIDDVEPYVSINGRKEHCLLHFYPFTRKCPFHWLPHNLRMGPFLHAYLEALP